MAQNYGPKIVKDGLVLALDAADINSYSGMGTIWRNLVNPSLNADLINGVSYSSSNRGVMVFDGTNDLVYAPSVNTLGGISNHTFEIWVKSPGLGPGKYLGGLICPDYGIISDISGGEVRYYVYNTDAWPSASYLFSLQTSGANMFSNQWKHVVCARQNGGTARIYINGVLNTESGNTGNWSGSTIWSSMNVQIGNNPNDSYYHLNGNIGLAKIYNRYLTSTEVLQNYNMTKGRYI